MLYLRIKKDKRLSLISISPISVFLPSTKRMPGSSKHCMVRNTNLLCYQNKRTKWRESQRNVNKYVSSGQIICNRAAEVRVCEMITIFQSYNANLSIGRYTVGVGAGKFLGVQRIFAQISLNLPEKNFGHFLCKYFSWRPYFGWLPKKGLDVILDANFSNQSTLGAIFAHVFREFAQIFRDFARVFADFAQISTDFAQIFRDFSRIFTKSNFFGVL